MEPRMMCVDTTSGTFYFFYAEEPDPLKRYEEGVIPMRKHGGDGHIGFLRGEEVSYDSLLNHYVQMPLAFQQQWSDSVYRANNR